jgi:hypothetical protein
LIAQLSRQGSELIPTGRRDVGLREGKERGVQKALGPLLGDAASVDLVENAKDGLDVIALAGEEVVEHPSLI